MDVDPTVSRREIGTPTQKWDGHVGQHSNSVLYPPVPYDNYIGVLISHLLTVGSTSI